MTSFSSFDMASYKFGSNKRAELMAMAKASEGAERYDDMCQFMKHLVESSKGSGEGLSVEERNLLSVAYKNVIGSRRASWRTVTAENEGNYPDNVKEKFLKYKIMIEDELKNICDEILDVLDSSCVVKGYVATAPSGANEAEKKEKAEEGEAQVFYLKMAGDYYRYLAETVSDPKYEEKTDEYYKSAMDIAKIALQATHPIRLGLALNYSVCFYEILKNKKAACELAKQAFDDAISKLDALEEADYKDSTLIMQLLRDNLTLWTSSNEEDPTAEDQPQ